jgi:hypothetical protein
LRVFERIGALRQDRPERPAKAIAVQDNDASTGAKPTVCVSKWDSSSLRVVPELTSARARIS